MLARIINKLILIDWSWQVYSLPTEEKQNHAHQAVTFISQYEHQCVLLLRACTCLSVFRCVFTAYSVLVLPAHYAMLSGVICLKSFKLTDQSLMDRMGAYRLHSVSY